MIKSCGKLKVKYGDKVYLDLHQDIIEYYKWFLKRELWTRFSGPKHKAHVSLALKNIHGKINWGFAKSLEGKVYNFEYDPDFITGGLTKNKFRNYYLRVFSSELETIKKRMGIKDNSMLHITFANTKNIRLTSLFPKMIEIR